MMFDPSGETIRKLFIWGLILFFSVPFGYYYGFTYWKNGAAGAAVGFVFGSVFTVIALTVVSRIAGLFGAIAGERKANFSLREQMESDIQQIRYHKMKKEYDIALRKVNRILKLDPQFPEALFLKAQIVWEGFGNSASAVKNLEKIIMPVSDKQSAIYRWANALLEEIREESNSQ